MNKEAIAMFQEAREKLAAFAQDHPEFEEQLRRIQNKFGYAMIEAFGPATLSIEQEN